MLDYFWLIFQTQQKQIRPINKAQKTRLCANCAAWNSTTVILIPLVLIIQIFTDLLWLFMPCLAFFDWFLQTQQKQIRPINKAKKTRLAVMAPMTTVHWSGERGLFMYSLGSSNVNFTVFSCTPPLFSATQTYEPKKEVKREHIRLNLTKLVLKVAWLSVQKCAQFHVYPWAN